ncbi:hypothetical protein D3C72_1205420 [compost metagenome]
MELRRIARAEAEDQRAGAVRVAQVEGGVGHQRAHGVDGALAGVRAHVAALHALEREPLVDDQRVLLEALVEIRQRVLAARREAVDQRRQRRGAVGHVVGLLVVGVGQRLHGGVAAVGQIAERQVAQRAAGHRIRVGAVRPRSGVGFICGEPFALQRAGQALAHEQAGAVDRGRIGHAHALG